MVAGAAIALTIAAIWYHIESARAVRKLNAALDKSIDDITKGFGPEARATIEKFHRDTEQEKNRRQAWWEKMNNGL